MKISRQNKVISIAAGVLSFGLLAGLIDVGAFIVAPATTVILWGYFSKKEQN